MEGEPREQGKIRKGMDQGAEWRVLEGHSGARPRDGRATITFVSVVRLDR